MNVSAPAVYTLMLRLPLLPGTGGNCFQNIFRKEITNQAPPMRMEIERIWMFFDETRQSEDNLSDWNAGAPA
jgi:hypothetical protein